MINDTIKSVKPWVKFGISPFGVWRNRSDDPAGSDTRAGVTNYDHLYANIIKWQKNGWIDYTLPQIYWHIGHPAANFETLANWWKNHTYNRAMYIGHAVYKIDRGSPIARWTTAEELPWQIRLLRQIPEINGSAFYSSKHFKRDLNGFQDSLFYNLYNRPALVPPMPWLDNDPPLPVKKLKRRGKKVKWKTVTANNEPDNHKKVILYLNQTGENFDKDNSDFIYTILSKDDKKFKFPRINRKRERYEVRISVIDRMNNESELSEPVVLKL